MQQLQADAAGDPGWNAQVGSSIMRVHQHAAGAPRRGRHIAAAPGTARTANAGQSTPVAATTAATA
ncbi:hypothetical protein [Dactylosporangium sp. CA-233914]|uniref:hypothetical protein n=1 Tax=Dactylosporangium sp. CA-233914 TaxID=3239934 RepID=UPI003D920375